mmetsp:Transcript_19379/g.17188  ORF Transcript_19379/g.17188 Transcript_19379/m.17188 type:complete len:104 (+) Transcript_19379:1-312(+)
MEYCTGGQLFDVIIDKTKSNESFKESEAIKIMKNLLSAVEFCHDLKIAHRDIKPENILLSNTGELKLIDFGISKQLKNKKMSTVVGTPYYMAPEILSAKYGIK